MDSPVPRMDSSERIARLRLARSQNVGPITFRQLIARYGSGADALEALPSLTGRNGRRLRIPSLDDVEHELDVLSDNAATLLVLGEPEYPEPLAETEDAPPVLIAKGRLETASSRCIGIVGARNASAIGVRLARKLADELGEEGFIIVSGLARGIDTAAHQGSIENGTVAVLGGGIDVCYPKENSDLQERIADDGLLLSEHPLGTQPQASHFPRRNRVISGLSVGVIVVEAAMRSGSLITARLAGEQGREVFAVPGSPMDPRARGTNNLIRQGATLIESAYDVIDALSRLHQIPLSERPAFEFETGPTAEIDADTESEHDESALDTIQDKLSPVAAPIDDIVRISGLSPAKVMTILLELELAGIARRHPGNRVSLA